MELVRVPEVPVMVMVYVPVVVPGAMTRQVDLPPPLPPPQAVTAEARPRERTRSAKPLSRLFLAGMPSMHRPARVMPPVASQNGWSGFEPGCIADWVQPDDAVVLTVRPA